MKHLRTYLIIGVVSLIFGAAMYIIHFPIKANGKSKLYHFLGCQSYFDTVIGNDVGDEKYYFKSSAEKNGFTKAKNCP